VKRIWTDSKASKGEAIFRTKGLLMRQRKENLGKSREKEEASCASMGEKHGGDPTYPDLKLSTRGGERGGTEKRGREPS